jgi:hypothetical protein
VIAERLGEDRNDFWTVFGPTNVGIHRASVAVELGDAGRAVEQARAIDPSQLPSLERRAHHLLDLVRALGSGARIMRRLTPCCTPSGWPPKKSISSRWSSG